MMNNHEAAEMIRNDMKLHHDYLSGKYRKALNMAISALQAQDSPKPKAESVQNVQNEDLISRKAAIDVLATMQGLCTSKAALIQNSKIWQQIKDLPSAQPDTKAQLPGEGTTSDLISRQDAIDVLSVFTQADALGHTPKQIVEALPSAHQEIEERKEESAQNVPKEDLISRNAAIDYCYALINAENPSDEWNYSQERINQTEVILHHLEFMPSAEPETAKRIVGKSRNGMTLWYQCDMCNEPVDAQDNFCRGCGRRLTDG